MADRFRFVSDDDGHTYLIPADKKQAFDEWLEAETAWEHCRLVQGAGEVRPIMERRKTATAALRAAADKLKGEGE
jgi:hypothetical protein